MPSEWAKDIAPGSTYATSEYDFYKNVKAGGNYGLQALSPEERTLYSILEGKVAYGGIESLNKKDLQSSGSIRDKNNSVTYQTLGERLNPVVVNSINEAQSRIGSAKLTDTDHGNGSKLPAGLYRDTGLNRYYFVINNKKKDKNFKFNEPQLKTYTLDPLKKPVDPTPNPQIDFPKARTQKAPDADLIFNSPDYKATYEEVIREMSLSLIMSGDDIISSYNYESIDSLPDIDVEIMISGGEYLNAKEVIDKGLGGEILQSLIDGSISSEEAELANKILLYLESLIGEEATYSKKMKYFGKLSPNNSTFTPGVARDGDSLLIDFNVDLPDSFQIPGANEIRVRFDPV